MLNEYKSIVVFVCLIANMINIHTSKKISIAQIIWGGIVHNFAEMIPE